MADATVAIPRPNALLLRRGAVGGLLGGAVLAGWMSIYEGLKGMGFATIVNACFASLVYGNSTMASMGAEAQGSMAESGAHTAGSDAGASMPAGPAATMGSEPMAHTGVVAGSGTMAHHGASMGMAHEGTMASGHGASATMNGPVVASHAVVGSIVHLAFSAGAAMAIALILVMLARRGLGFLWTAPGLTAATVAAGALLYVVMMYGYLPAVNSPIATSTPRGAFLAGHLVYGAVLGSYLAARYGLWREPRRVAGALRLGEVS